MGIIVRKLGHLIDLKTYGIRDDEIEKVIKQWLLGNDPCNYTKGSGKPMTVGEVITYLKDHMLEFYDDFDDATNWELKASNGAYAWNCGGGGLMLSPRGGTGSYVVIGTKNKFDLATQIRAEFWMSAISQEPIHYLDCITIYDTIPISGKFGDVILFENTQSFSLTKFAIMFYHSGGKSYFRADKLVDGVWELFTGPTELGTTEREGKTYLSFKAQDGPSIYPYNSFTISNLRVWRKETSG